MSDFKLNRFIAVVEALILLRRCTKNQQKALLRSIISLLLLDVKPALWIFRLRRRQDATAGKQRPAP
jgi:hypothetical protein